MRLFLLLMLSVVPPAWAASVRFYVGTYTDKSPSQGIYTACLDTESGRLSSLELASKAPSPNFLAIASDNKTLYSIVSTNGGSVAAFRMKLDGRLDWLNHLPSGKGGCHVSVDATGRNVMVANYSAGSLAGFRTKPDGSLDNPTTTIPFTGSGPNPKRQDKPYLHAGYFSRDNHFFYACDLGSDSVWQFRLNQTNGDLQPLTPPAAKVPPGSGPRHLAFSPDGKFAFVNGEMALNVTVFGCNPQTGNLQSLQTVSLLPPDTATDGLTSAEIHCHPNGKWLYVSVRDTAGQGRDELVILSVTDTGKLKRVQNFPAGVKVPRGFGVDPTGQWLLVGGQQDNQIAVVKIDRQTGKLSATRETAKVGAPVCVVFQGAAN